MKNFFKRSGITIIILAFILSLIPALSSCTPELNFENIVISEDAEKDTNEPINPKNEFEISAPQIYATVKYFGTKGGDNWNFKWTNIDTNEIVLDKGDKYKGDEPDDIFEGIVSSYIYPLGGGSIPAGNYKVEFFNNGELISTTTFKVNAPTMEIMEVKLASTVDENGAPINETQQFSLSDTVHATVKLNYQITGNSFRVIWKDSAEKVLSQIDYDIPGDYYEGSSYIWFMLQLTGGEIANIGPGNYQVEIYFNDSLYGAYDFEVMEGNLVTFDQGTVFENANFRFSIAIPDNWTYTESITKGEASFNLAPPGDASAVFLFKAVMPQGYKPYKEFSENDAKDFSAQQGWVYKSSSEEDYELKNGTPYKEYMYLYDDDSGEWALVYSFIEKNDYLYLFIAIANIDSYGDIAQAVYYGMLDTLTFK